MKLAIKLPGGNEVSPPSELTQKGFTDVASFISPFLNIIFYIVTFITFYFLIWGAFAYIMARGNKEELSKARARITWAIVGLAVVFLSYSIARFASEIFPPTKGGLPF